MDAGSASKHPLPEKFKIWLRLFKYSLSMKTLRNLVFLATFRRVTLYLGQFCRLPSSADNKSIFLSFIDGVNNGVKSVLFTSF